MTISLNSSYLTVAKKNLSPALRKKLATKAQMLNKEQLPKVIQQEKTTANKIYRCSNGDCNLYESSGCNVGML